MNEPDKVKIRNGMPLDHVNIVSVMTEWWGGRDLSFSVLKVFFISCTSPVNKLSIIFHQKMGFEIEPGNGAGDDVSVTLDYLGKGNHKVLFKKILI